MKRTPCLVLSLLALTIGVSAELMAAAFPFGLPPSHQTLPDPEFNPRLYTVAQAPDGMLYVGGQEGVHSYDGRRWNTTGLPNGLLVRSLRHDGNERIYVGGYGQFGFIELDETGHPQFQDLTPIDSLVDAANFADIWRIEVTPEGVFFRALYHLFRYQPDTGQLDTWYHPGRFGAIVWHDDALLLQFRGIGLKRLQDERFELIEGGDALKDHVVGLLPLPDGGLLTIARDGLWRRLHEGQVQAWDAPANMPSSESFDAWLVLPDGSFALGGSDGRLHIVDPETRVNRTIQVGDGFVSELAPATGGGILIQTDKATTHLFWPSRWTRLGAESGLIGRIQKVVPWQDAWLVISNSGVFRTSNRNQRFENTGWTTFEAWDWLTIDSDTALLADSFTIYRVKTDADPRPLIEDTYPRLLKRSEHDDRLIHVGTERGLALLMQGQEDWSLHYQQPNFTGRVDSIIELNRHELLLAVNGTGMVRARYSDDYRELLEWQVYEPEEGIEYTQRREAHAVRFDDNRNDNRIVVSTLAGFFQWTGQGFEVTDLEGLSALVKPGLLYTLQQDPGGRWWAYHQRELWHRPPDGQWKQENLTALEVSQIESLSFNPGLPVMVGDIAAILQFDQTVEPLTDEAPDVALRSAIVTDHHGITRRLPLDGRPIELPHNIDNIVFEYVVPSYRRPDQHRYRARLLGYEDRFGEWGRITRITYSALTPGLKRFEVQAIDSSGRSSSIRPLELQILPPWYLTIWAMILWIVLLLSLLVLLFYLLVRWRLARLTAERERLADMVDQRTAELAAANRKLKNMANVDGLTGVANRRRLDEYLEEAWQRCADRSCQLAVILIDVDHFKNFNDTQGHQAGDEVLREVANLLATSLRRNEDVVARYGGEEFMVVMPAASIDMARDVAETMRQRIAESPLGVTASMGIASVWPGSEQAIHPLIERADQALYRAKENGRNRVETDNT